MDNNMNPNELAGLIDEVLNGLAPPSRLRDYVWAVIAESADAPPNRRSVRLSQDEDRAFWYAVWQIQHIADEDGFPMGVWRLQLQALTRYLRREEALPKECLGQPPSSDP